MKPLHDPDLRKDLFCYGLCTLLLSGAGLCLSPLLGLGLLLGCTASLGVHLLALRRRRARLQRLSTDLSGLLDGSSRLRLEEYREGELAVLRSELQKLLTQLQASNLALQEERTRLADAMADISHQLRTPMTSMELMLALIQSPSVTEERRRQLYRELNTLLQRTEWLISALLKLSRLDAGAVRLQPQEISLAELVRRAYDPLAVAMELHELQFHADLPEGSLNCDPLWTAEALGNLLKNAIEHTPPGGTVSLSAAVTPVYTQFILRDSGSGFAPEDLPHLFERFYRGKNADQGSFGIGLSLARRILAEQDCTIKAANHPEGGAEFTLRFYHSIV